MTIDPNDLEGGTEEDSSDSKMLLSGGLLKKARPRRSYRHIPEGFHFLLEGNPHPLLIPCIVSEIASYLPVSDLKVFRQVCTQWNDEAYKQLRRTAKIVLHGEENLVAFTRLSSPNFHTNFELRGDLELGSSAVQKFFIQFGDRMKYVCFNRVKWKETELKDLLFEKLPNLEELGLEARAYSDRRLFPGGSDIHDLGVMSSGSGNVTVVHDSTLVLPKIRVLRLNIFSLMTEVTTPFLRDVLRACPEVEVISSLKTSSISNPLPMPFIQYICQAMNYDTADDLVHMPYAADIAIAEAIIETKGLRLSKLAKLDCNMRLRTHGLNQLALKGYPLRQLDLTIMSDVTSCTLKSLLSSVQNTLQVLKLKFQPGCPAAEVFVTPDLEKLTTLTLNGFKCSFKFLEQLPNLKTLTFIRINLQRALAMEAIPCRHPLEIECFQVFEEFSMDGLAGDTIRLLAFMFPRVKRLKLENLCDESLVEVFAEFPLLEELDALNGFYTDTGITGIKKSVFVSSQNSLQLENFMRFKEKPEISCLKKNMVHGSVRMKRTFLKQYNAHRIEIEPTTQIAVYMLQTHIRSLSLGSPKITDHSFLYGVLLCKSLRRLHILSYGITDISLLRLSKELDLFYLKTEYCFQLTENAVCEVHEQMKGRQLSLNEYTGPMKQSEIPKFMRRNWNVAVRINKLEAYHHIPPLETANSDINLVVPSLSNEAADDNGESSSS